MTDSPSLPSSSQVTCHQNITGMLLASSLPISSGASPYDFLQNLRCTPQHTPPDHPAPPCISGRKLALRPARTLRLPSSSLSLPRAWHLVPFYLPSLSTFASVLETSAGRGIHTHAWSPTTSCSVCHRKGKEGLQGSRGKEPHKRPWDGPKEAVKMDLHLGGERRSL